MKKTHQSENEVESDIIENYLRPLGWVCRRQHRGNFYTRDGRRVSVGDEGESDWRCLKAVNGYTIQYFELETKATGEKPTAAQKEYIAKRNKQGFIALWADSLEMFKEKSGL